jgi:hypothetical protein
MSIGIGILFLLVASAFAIQCWMCLEDKGPVPVLLIGLAALCLLSSSTTLEVLRSHGDAPTILLWMAVAVGFACEAIAGICSVLVLLEDEAEVEYPPEVALFAGMGAIDMVIAALVAFAA